MRFKILALACASAAMLALPAHAQTEIQWWHAMSGPLGDWVNDLAKQYNESQKEYKIVPTYKGQYDETMTAAIAAYRSGNAPTILQVFEVGTATMIASKGAIKPVAEVMKEGGAKFDQSVYIPAVAGYYTAPNGQMLSFPLNSSTTIFYYNKDAFRAAGLDPDKAPATWPEVVAAAAKLKASGHKCPFTTSWMSWTQLESFSMWHNTLFASKNNGFGGTDARLAFNSPLHVRHFENLANMAKQGLFVYKGRNNTRRRGVPGRRMRDDDRLLGLYGGRQGRQVRLRPGAPALLPRRGRRAAEHRHRRRQPVGDVGQEAGGVQGRRRFFNYLSKPKCSRPATSAPATCRSPWPPSRPPRNRASTRKSPAPTWP